MTVSDGEFRNPQNRPSFTFYLLQPIRQTIAHPKGPVSAFFGARFVLKSAKRTIFRGFDKTKDMVFRE